MEGTIRIFAGKDELFFNIFDTLNIGRHINITELKKTEIVPVFNNYKKQQEESTAEKFQARKQYALPAQTVEKAILFPGGFYGVIFSDVVETA